MKPGVLLRKTFSIHQMKPDQLDCKSLCPLKKVKKNYSVIEKLNSRIGKCIFNHKQHKLVAAMEVEVNPCLILTNSVSIPGRTLAVVQVDSTLTKEQSNHLYKVKSNHLLMNDKPNLHILSTIHKVEVYKPSKVPFVAINFSSDSIYLPMER